MSLKGDPVNSKSSISVISGQFHATRQNEQKHGKAFSELELKNIANEHKKNKTYQLQFLTER